MKPARTKPKLALLPTMYIVQQTSRRQTVFPFLFLTWPSGCLVFVFTSLRSVKHPITSREPLSMTTVEKQVKRRGRRDVGVNSPSPSPFYLFFDGCHGFWLTRQPQLGRYYTTSKHPLAACKVSEKAHRSDNGRYVIGLRQSATRQAYSSTI